MTSLAVERLRCGTRGSRLGCSSRCGTEASRVQNGTKPTHCSHSRGLVWFGELLGEMVRWAPERNMDKRVSVTAGEGHGRAYQMV